MFNSHRAQHLQIVQINDKYFPANNLTTRSFQLKIFKRA